MKFYRPSGVERHGIASNELFVVSTYLPKIKWVGTLLKYFTVCYVTSNSGF
jgi:hypothetical protein